WSSVSSKFTLRSQDRPGDDVALDLVGASVDRSRPAMEIGRGETRGPSIGIWWRLAFRSPHGQGLIASDVEQYLGSELLQLGTLELQDRRFRIAGIGPATGHFGHHPQIGDLERLEFGLERGQSPPERWRFGKRPPAVLHLGSNVPG